MIMKKFISLYVISIANLLLILLIYIQALISNNNHYGIALDTFSIITSGVLFIVVLFFRYKTLIILTIISLLLSVFLNIFNISIHYDKWIKRYQPDPFTYVDSTN
jgi:hypothetical protein